MGGWRAVLILSLLLVPPSATASFEGGELRQDTETFMRKVGMEEEFTTPVRVGRDEQGLIGVVDPGTFFSHYVVLQPEKALGVPITVEPGLAAATCDKVVVVTHGWIDKGGEDWPADMVREIANLVDPNEWVCMYYDWKRGAAVINPTDAARYARDLVGPRMARAVLSLTPKPRHVHLIGHSAGSWAVQTAAAELQTQTDTTIHITFLDAYVPPRWDADELGDIGGGCWCDHYYTKDFTLKMTHARLAHAHNVDITAADPWFKEHEFPWRWYYATICGRFDHWRPERKTRLLNEAGGVVYGYGRSREAGEGTWSQSLGLALGNRPVRVRSSRLPRRTSGSSK